MLEMALARVQDLLASGDGRLGAQRKAPIPSVLLRYFLIHIMQRWPPAVHCHLALLDMLAFTALQASECRTVTL